MTTTPLFSSDEIQQAGGSAPSASGNSLPPSGGLFSPDEISAASGGSNGTDIGHQPASLRGVLQTLKPGNGGLTAIVKGVTDPIMHPIDTLEGIGEGALQTVAGTGKLIQKAGNAVSPGLGDKIVPPTGAAALQQIATPDNPQQQIGKSAEDIAEFVGGDEAVKSLSLGERLLKIGKVAETYETGSPFVKKAIEAGMNATRQGAVGAVEGAAKTGEVSQGIKTGAAAAVAAPVAEASADLAGKAASKIADVSSDFWNSVAGNKIQKNLRNALNDTMSSTAEDAGIGQVKFPNVRDTVKSVADAIQDKSKGLYKVIDDATSGEFTNLQNKIKNVDFQLRNIAGTDDAAEERLFNQKIALNSKLDDAIEAAQNAGVNPEVADAARAAWKQSSALADLDYAVKASTSGPAAGRGSFTNSTAKEALSPAKLAPRLEKLWDSGRVQDALGEYQAGRLYDAVHNAASQAQSRASRIAIAKTAAKYGGASAVLGGAVEVGRALSGSGK